MQFNLSMLHAYAYTIMSIISSAAKMSALSYVQLIFMLL